MKSLSSTEIEFVKSNLKNYLESHNINTSKMFHCINPNHLDKNASMKYFNDNRVYCFGCGASYNLFDVISIMENLPQKEAFKKALDYYAFGKSISPTKPIKKQVEVDENNVDLKDYTKAYKVWENALENEKTAKNYLKERKIDEKTAKKFNLGYNEFNFGNKKLKAIIIPITKNSFTSRNIDKTDTEFRYYKTKGNHTDIFNKSALTNDIPFCFITEGEFDCMSFESIGANAIALGSACNINKFKSLDLDKKKVYIVALDNDEAGFSATDDLANFFKQNKMKYILTNSVDYKDANEALINDEEGFKFFVNNIIKQAMRKVNQEEMC